MMSYRFVANLAKVSTLVLTTMLILAACSSGDPTPTPLPTVVPTASPNPTIAPTIISMPTNGPTATTVPTLTPTTMQEVTVFVGDIRFTVEVARTTTEQRIGLSGRDQLAAGTGMLFPQRSERIAAFWMRGMLISLDFLWIGGDCRVSDVTLDVPPPDDPNQSVNLPIYSPSSPVLYVLEVNAGEVQASGITIGDAVRFENTNVTPSVCEG